MLKQSLLVLAAAGLISIAVRFAAAQDSPSNTQQPPPAQDNGGRHHGPPFDPAHRAAELTKKLNLTSDQQPKVLEALQSEHSQMESLHQDSSLSQQDRRSKMKAIQQDSKSKIEAVLNDTQKQQYEQMLADRRAHRRNQQQAPQSEQPGQ